jgi:hypothetical protein
MHVCGRDYTKRELERRTGNLDQIGGTRHYNLISGRSKGVEAIEFNTGTGFQFTVIPDRGLDIAHCTYRGISLVYLTPNGVVHPAFYEPEGFGWLRTFFGGLLTTCGLTYFGNPGNDGDEELGLHGRYSTLPADRVCDRSRWEGDAYILEITGEIRECALFGEKISLERSIRTEVGKRSLIVRDRVENFGFNTAPLCILYHINAGFPLLDEQSELILTSKKVEPYDDTAEAGLGKVTRFSGPVHDFMGQDFLHTMAQDSDGYAHAALVNQSLYDGLGLYMRFDTRTLPYLNEWKMLGEGDYVLGIEPVNTIILNRAALRKRDQLPLIEPGEVKEMKVEIGVLKGQSEIQEFIGKVESVVPGAP